MNDNKMTSGELRATWSLGAVFSLRMLGMFMVLPVLTTYGMALAGATPTLIGLAIGIYGLTQAIFQIPFGLASDRLGRIPLIVFGLAIFAVGSAVAAGSDSIWGVIVGRALQGSGAVASVVMALISDLTREQNRTKAMAFLGISFGVTFAIAMVLGPIITQAWGLNALFWGIAVLAIIGIILTLTAVPKPPRAAVNRETSVITDDFKKVLRNPQLLKLNLSILILHMLLMTSFVVLPLTMESAGIFRADQWRVYLFTMLISFAFVMPLIAYAEKKRRMKQIFLLCISVTLSAEIVLYFMHDRLPPWGVLLGIQLFFIGFNVMEAILPSWISKEAPAGYRGTAMGVYSTGQFIGTALGGAIGGALYEFGGPNLVFSSCAVVALVWLLISATMRQPPYVSSLRLALPPLTPQQLTGLEQKLIALKGITDVVIVAAERAAYIKIDRQKIDRAQVETAIGG